MFGMLFWCIEPLQLSAETLEMAPLSTIASELCASVKLPRLSTEPSHQDRLES